MSTFLTNDPNISEQLHLPTMIYHRRQTTTLGTVKATCNRPNIMYTEEKLGTVPDEEVERENN